MFFGNKNSAMQWDLFAHAFPYQQSHHYFPFSSARKKQVIPAGYHNHIYTIQSFVNQVRETSLHSSCYQKPQVKRQKNFPYRHPSPQGQETKTTKKIQDNSYRFSFTNLERKRGVLITTTERFLFNKVWKSSRGKIANTQSKKFGHLTAYFDQTNEPATLILRTTNNNQQWDFIIYICSRYPVATWYAVFQNKRPCNPH